MAKGATFLLDAGDKSPVASLTLPDDERASFAILVAQPLVEERKCSLRPLVEASRAFADKLGAAVLRIDYPGTGDSPGGFADFTPQDWIAALESGAKWLADHLGGLPLTCLGARSGALLLCASRDARIAVAPKVLWDPVGGNDAVRQWAQRHMVCEMIAYGKARTTVREAERRWSEGGIVDLDGFGLSGAQRKAFGELAPAAPSSRTLVVLTSKPAPATDAWLRECGGAVETARLDLPPYWNQVGYVDTAPLRDLTLKWLAEGNAECRMQNAECATPNAQCTTPNAQCIMHNAQCGAGPAAGLTQSSQSFCACGAEHESQRSAAGCLRQPSGHCPPSSHTSMDADGHCPAMQCIAAALPPDTKPASGGSQNSTKLSTSNLQLSTSNSPPTGSISPISYLLSPISYLPGSARQSPVAIGPLRAILHRPQGEIKRTVLFLHGWSGDRQGPHRMFVDFARRLAADGVASLRIDFRGRGESDGEDATIASMTDDAEAACNWLKSEGLLKGGLEVAAICSGTKVAIALATRFPPERLVLLSAEAMGSLRAKDAGAAKTLHALRAYARKLLRRETWRKIFKGEVRTDMVGKALVRHETRSAEEAVWEDKVLAHFAAFGGELRFIFGGSDPAAAATRSAYGRFCDRHGLNASFATVESAGHSYYAIDWTDEVFRLAWGKAD